MRKAMSLFLPLVTAVVVSACCSRENGQAAANVAQASAAPAASPASVTANINVREDSVPGMALVYPRVDGMSLEAKVEKVACNEGRGDSAEVRVKWTAPEGVNFTRISAAARGEDGKTWVEAGGSGEEVTGAWVGDGTVLALYDASTQTELARITAEATSCGGQ